MIQTIPTQDTVLLAEEAAPLDVAQGQLDAALAAQLEVPAFLPPPPAPVADPETSLVVPLMLVVALVLLFGLRAMARGGRGWIARFVQRAAPTPASPAAQPTPVQPRSAQSRPAQRPEPSRARPMGTRPAPSVPRPPPPPPPRKTVELPPHVAAMLSRMEERRGAGAAPSPATPPPAASAPEPPAPPTTLGDRGLDVVIGS